MTHESPKFIYDYHTGPTKIKPDDFLERVVAATPDDALALNCQLFTSAITRARGYRVPDDYRSSEHFEDPEGFLKDVTQSEVQKGDIIGFSRSEKTDPKRIHLTVVKHNLDGSIHLLHASQESGTVEETPLKEIQERERHKTLRFVRRPVEIFNGREPNPTALRKLKFF